jgi:2-polyprenyl-6-methoxyphenol hydroxylase-like FAD-dependent oxidoreductase
MERVPVAIVGGGPVGLVAALELARYGIRSLLVERHEGTTWHPKARNLNTRTMEISRGWGAAVHDALVGINLPRAWTSQIIYTRTLAGEELGRMPTAGFSGPGHDVSPEVPLLSSQDVFEPIFRRGAEATGMADLRFGHEAGRLKRGSALGDDRAVIEVTERASGRRYEVEAEFLLAADGAASGVREQLAIELDGPRGLGHFVNVYFRADLDPWVAHRPALLFWVSNGAVRGVFQPLDARGRWLCQIAYDGTPATFESYTAGRSTEWIRAAVGDSAVTPEILSIGSWTLNGVVAQSFHRGRVMLVGDAAAQLPPIGGFGVNTGIQGLHNLVWKLALVRAGVAAPSLLDTYETERRAVARYNVERSLENSRMVERINAAARGETGPALSPSEAVAASRRYGNFLGMELGYRYESAAIVADDSEPDRVEDEVIDYVSSARPGKRAPHAWIERAGRRSSILDLFGPHFTLLVGRGDAARIEPAREAADELGVPLETHVLGADFEDAEGRFTERYAIGADGAVLVRPDGHVGFRGGLRGLDAALRQILIRSASRDRV